MTKENPAARIKKFTEGLLFEKRILTALDIRHGQTVIDAGCGTGYMAETLSTTESSRNCSRGNQKGDPIELVLNHVQYDFSRLNTWFPSWLCVCPG